MPQVLAAPDSVPEQLEVLGELMRQSHVSYSRCGLWSSKCSRGGSACPPAHLMT